MAEHNELIMISDDIELIIISSDDENEESIDENMDTDSENELCCFAGTCAICSEETEDRECCFEGSCLICSEEREAETRMEENEQLGFRIENGVWSITLTFGDTEMTFNSENREQLTRIVVLFLHEIGLLQFFNARYY